MLPLRRRQADGCMEEQDFVNVATIGAKCVCIDLFLLGGLNESIDRPPPSPAYK